MYATLLTVLLVAGGQPECVGAAQQPSVVDPYCGPVACSPANCTAGCNVLATLHSALAACFGPMPQTCYAPRFGCYPGNDRCMNRYPAFHGYYEREAYNYRQLFDYPWHAAPYEPQAYLALEVYEPAIGEPIAAPTPAPIAPSPASPDR